MRFRAASLSAVVVAALAATGCSKKVPECNSVIEVIHTASNAIKANKAEGNEKAKAVVVVDEKAAADLAKLELTIPEVKKFSEDFQKAYKADADETKRFSELTSAPPPDAAKIEALTKEIEASGQNLAKLAEDMDKFCQGK